MNNIQLTTSKIDIGPIHDSITDDGCGACSVFVGTTRDTFEGKTVISLEYEAYESMALKEMRNICSELRTRWPNLKHIVIHHRLGSVPVGEASVVIATSSPHRADALESVSCAIDLLKARVPIWKKEMYENGEHLAEWKENKECRWPQYTEPRTFDLSSCKIDQTIEKVPEKLVQIRVNDSELNRRVECFLKRKRNEINLSNINDFNQHATTATNGINLNPLNTSCARTQSYLVKQKQSSGHLKVRRVNNNCGSQDGPNYNQELNKLMSSEKYAIEVTENKLFTNLRLQNIESFLGVASNDNDSILMRIKNMENRLLLLESSSPEYKCFLQQRLNVEKTNCRKPNKKMYMSDKLGEHIAKIKAEFEA